MSDADAPPDRKHLAAMLKVFARSGAYFGTRERQELLEYVEIAEDTITAQARMLAADTEELLRRAQVRRDQGQIIGDLGRECDRLKAENARLRALADAALIAGQLRNDADLRLVRQALEKTA